VTVPFVDQVEERVGGGRLVLAFPHLPEADVIDDEQLGPGPGPEAAGVGVVREPGVEVVEQVDAAGVAYGEGLLAGAHAEGLENMTLAGPALTGDDEIIAPSHEVEACELYDGGLVEIGLEVPVKSLEGLMLAKPAVGEAAGEPALELVVDLGGEDGLEERSGTFLVTRGGGEQRVEVAAGVGQSEEGEVSSESLCGEVVSLGSVVSAGGSSGHDLGSWS